MSSSGLWLIAHGKYNRHALTNHAVFCLQGHRPGIDEKFLEQWHQKLHQNSNVDDIAIGEAYLAYLSSEGNFDEFKRVSVCL